MWPRVTPSALLIGSVAIVAALGWRPITPSQSDDERAIHTLEEEIEAATGRNDADALSTLWAPDYMFVNPAGLRLTRDDRLQLFRSGSTRLERYTRDQESIRIYGTTAIVFFRSTVAGARGDLDISSRRRVTMIIVKRDGRWQAVSQQTSRILETATGAVVAPLPAVAKLDPSFPKNAEADVGRVEREIADATEKNDADAFERLWAAEFVWIGPIGQVLTRADRLGAIRSGSEKSQRYSIDQETIRVYGATAVVVFRSTVAGGTVNGKDVSSQRSVTNVLVRRDGRWQAVSQHSTLIQSP
jgi:ketosteroid isomerase-like protein